MNPWKVGLAAVLFLFAAVALFRACGFAEPLVIPNWADSLRVVRTAYQIENAAHRAEVARVQAVADSAKRTSEAWRLRSLAVRPTRPPRVGTTVPDSGSTREELVQIVATIAYKTDSLWAALDAADSAYATLDSAFRSQRQATAAALAGWAAADSSLAQHDKLANLAITDLTARLKKAQRGCRVFWVVSCPEIAGGYGAVLSNGQVHHGPGVQVGFKIKLGGG